MQLMMPPASFNAKFELSQDLITLIFSVDTTGQYNLKFYDSSHNTGTVLSQGSTSPINSGQPYVLAVVANFSNIGLYVNQQPIASVTDGTLNHGQIGVLVGNLNSSSAVAVFSHAKVWML